MCSVANPHYQSAKIPEEIHIDLEYIALTSLSHRECRKEIDYYDPYHGDCRTKHTITFLV